MTSLTIIFSHHLLDREVFMKKEFFALILCLVLFMTNNALSAEDIEPEEATNPTYHQHIHQIHTNQNQGTPCPSLSDFLPSRWTLHRVQSMALLVGATYLHYLLNAVEERKCYPAINSTGFDKL